MNDFPGTKIVPSGMVTSLRKTELSQEVTVFATGTTAEIFWGVACVDVADKVGLASGVAVDTAFGMNVGEAAASWAERVSATAVYTASRAAVSVAGMALGAPPQPLNMSIKTNRRMNCLIVFIDFIFFVYFLERVLVINTR